MKLKNTNFNSLEEKISYKRNKLLWNDYFEFIFGLNNSVAGNKVSAPILDPSMLNAIKIPKYTIGSRSEKTSTENPADTEIKLINIAFPLTNMVSLIAFSISFDSFKTWLKWVIKCME